MLIRFLKTKVLKSRFSIASFIYSSTFLLVVIYFEFFHVWLNTLYWDSVSSHKESLRILIVADPQLIGYQLELPVIGPFTRWHSDRYVSQNYQVAKKHIQPHLVIFLGDLANEGETASSQELIKYHERFLSAFQLTNESLFTSSPSSRILLSSHIKEPFYIVIPGDNDVGGEDEGSPILLERLKNFQRFYGNTNANKLFELNGVKAKLFESHSLDLEATSESELKVLEDKISKFSQDKSDPPNALISLSHQPCLESYRYCSQIVKNIRPNIMLSAHSHTSSYGEFDSEGLITSKVVNFLLPSESSRKKNKSSPSQLDNNRLISQWSSSIEFIFKNKRLKNEVDENYAVHEITVPTCSYRMGVENMGFGALFLESHGADEIKAKYTVLWLPSGFKPLYIYITFYVLSKIIFTPWIFVKVLSFLCQKYGFWTNSVFKSDPNSHYKPLTSNAKQHLV